MAQPVLTKFWPIFACKSDGHEVVNQKGRPVRNGPTEAQLDRTPNAQGQADYYRLIEKDEPKHIDWRKKLGGMLLREIGGKQYEDKWQQCILYDFPEGYKLYEHIKSKADGQAKAVKNHSGGGHDRQDAYLYGYPKGPKKRFRSPIEFFPHLLWLGSDETSDYQNCTCRICCPVQLEEKPAIKLEFGSDIAINTIKKENSPSVAPPLLGRNPTVQIPPRRPSLGLSKSPSAQLIATNNTPRIKPPDILTSTPLPQPRSIDQQVDSQYGRFLGRTGEVVWFFRPKTTAWGLGLIVRRWVPQGGPTQSAYLIQPLSYPRDITSHQELVKSDQGIKPWLAWSVPVCTYAFLQQNPTLNYEQVDWDALRSGKLGGNTGIPDVDASILAAKLIDSTYTLFERLKTTMANGIEERHYNGIFLGAEKIWRGEPVRLRFGSGTDLMVVTDVVEKPYHAPHPNAPSPSKVFVIGDVYTYATLPVVDPSSPPSPPPNNNIPIRMREDMRWRNLTLVRDTRTLAYWKLIASSSRLEISEIKGRWYETSLVFVEPFLKAVKQNEGGNGLWMNSRGDATGQAQFISIAKSDRTTAFGHSIPKGTQIFDGLDVPDAQETNKPPTSEMHNLDMGMGIATGASDGFALDDFMNLEGMDEGGIAFGDNFHF
ncbi:transcription-silencing protein Clr2-domain-containing protein [Massariosphaeria phaeospora]|uniref:Transcription-silencing protein Clr2-domain-containing protein n=1 Tax=Massariosphaeria phaeospora TaxID=100035 RepID=A0A7C8I5J5_9PLEO|nr:transcription-silencing protein Clr2-domain-containing protein [Massariosphaeria phaeospora]